MSAMPVSAAQVSPTEAMQFVLNMPLPYQGNPDKRELLPSEATSFACTDQLAFKLTN